MKNRAIEMGTLMYEPSLLNQVQKGIETYLLPIPPPLPLVAVCTVSSPSVLLFVECAFAQGTGFYVGLNPQSSPRRGFIRT